MPKKIIIPTAELWDAKNNIFVYSKEQTIVIEHSLVSLSKWESKWHKPFLTKEKKTEETLYRKRLEACEQCDCLINGMCSKCGCFAEVRAAYKHNRCPHENRLW